MLILKRLAAALMLAGVVVLPAIAADASHPASGTSPVGSWQSADGQAKVKVTMCGDGTQLCATLTGVSGKARTPANVGLLNTYVVDRAEVADTNAWQGTVHFNGETALGHITMEGSNTIKVSGCQLGMCKTFQFNRI